jgi:hypothetical protein
MKESFRGRRGGALVDADDGEQHGKRDDDRNGRCAEQTYARRGVNDRREVRAVQALGRVGDPQLFWARRVGAVHHPGVVECTVSARRQVGIAPPAPCQQPLSVRIRGPAVRTLHTRHRPPSPDRVRASGQLLRPELGRLACYLYPTYTKRSIGRPVGRCQGHAGGTTTRELEVTHLTWLTGAWTHSLGVERLGNSTG